MLIRGIEGGAVSVFFYVFFDVFTKKRYKSGKLSLLNHMNLDLLHSCPVLNIRKQTLDEQT